MGTPLHSAPTGKGSVPPPGGEPKAARPGRALSAAQRKRPELEEARRKQELLESEELENRRVLEDAAKLEKQRAAHLKENEHREAKQVRFVLWDCCCCCLGLRLTELGGLLRLAWWLLLGWCTYY